MTRSPSNAACARRRAIATACKRRGWQLLELVEDAGLSATDLKRLGIEEARRVRESREAQALVAAKPNRLSQAMLDLATLIATAQRSKAGRSSPSTAPRHDDAGR